MIDSDAQTPEARPPARRLRLPAIDWRAKQRWIPAGIVIVVVGVLMALGVHAAWQPHQQDGLGATPLRSVGAAPHDAQAPTVQPEATRAAPDLRRWERFGLADGLPENSVLSVHQDRLGFLWLGTQNGLVRYDGAEMTAFAPDARDPDAIRERRGSGRILDAPGGDLWLGAEGALQRYDRSAGRFVTYPVDVPPTPIPGVVNTLKPVGYDAQGRIWCLDFFNTVYRFDPAVDGSEAAFRVYLHDPGDPASLSATYASRIPRWSPPVASQLLTYDAVLVDSRGGVWVGTLAGLNRYDPATDGWVRYRHDPDDPASLSSDTVYNLAEGDDGSIWVSTDRGLNRLDPASGRVAVYRHDPSDARTLSADLVIASYPDRAGVVWVSTAGGLDRLDAGSGAVTRTASGPDATMSTGSPEVSAWLLPEAESEAGLWFVTYGGSVVHYDRPSDTVTALDPAQVGEWVVTVAVDQAGTVWAGTMGSGLSKLDRTPQVAVLRSDPGGLSSDVVRAVYEPPSTPGVLWVGTDVGLDRLDRAMGGVARFRHVPGDAGSLTPGAVYAVHEDAEGRLWVGTEDGLSLLDRATGRATQTRRDPSGPSVLPADRVRAITSAPDGTVWLGVDDHEWSGGVVRLAPRTGSATTYKVAREAYAPELYRWIGTLPASRRLAPAVRPGPEAGTWREPFTLADSASVFVFGMGEWDGPSEPRDVVWLEDRAGRRVWDAASVTGTVDAGGWIGNRLRASVLRLGPGTYRVAVRATEGHGYGSWTNFGSPDHPELWGAHVWRLGPDGARTAARLLALRDENRLRGWETRALAFGAGRVWVASGDGGVAGLDPETGEVVVFFSSDDGPDSARGLVWDGGTLWVADYTHGLLRIDPERGLDRVVLDERGAPFSGVTGAIVQDEAGQIWLGTQTGLVRVDPGTGAVRRFGAENGVPLDAEMTAATRAADGTLLFATDAGLVSVVPAAFAGEAEPPPVALTGFDLAGEPVAPGPDAPLAVDVTVAERVVLGPRQDDFTIHYAPLRYDQPRTYATRYRLAGFDPGWIEAGADRRVRYTSLPPGTYAFEVQAASADGVWPETGRRLAVVVRPPWWRTVWAYLGYALAAAGLAVAVARERRRREDLRFEAERERVEAEQLRALDVAKSQFFANVSHEFRTPLTLTLGPLDDLRSGCYGELPAPATDALGLARRNAARVLDLVGQILDVARIESGRLALQARPLDLARFVEEIAALFRDAAAREGLTLVVEPAPPVEVWADPVQLEKVVANLLSNAVKFTPPGGTVRTQVDLDGGRARVRVHDDGPGIPADEVDRVFDRFYQVEGVPQRPLGTGIGLALAREVMELHGGTLEAESGSGGSAFTARLRLGRDHLTPDQVDPDAAPWAPSPLAETTVAGEGTAPPDGDSEPDADVTTVLVVEDDAELRAYVRRQLAGYRVIEAADGDAGLDLARQRLPDLVLSDVMMPGLDGLELCRALKADPSTDFIPVVLLTARAEREDRLAGLAELADDYLTKPFDADELRARVANLIAVRQRLRERLAAAPPSGDGWAGLPEREVELVSADQAFLDAVRESVAAGLGDEGYGAAQLAADVGLSRSQLNRKLNALLGMPSSQVIRSMRLGHAARLLEARAGTVSEVAYAVGFKSVSHFSDAFLDRYECRPSAYADERAA